MLSGLGIELGGHVAVGFIGFKLGWDDALGIALVAETRGASRCRWVCGAIIPHASVPVRYGLLFFDGALRRGSRLGIELRGDAEKPCLQRGACLPTGTRSRRSTQFDRRLHTVALPGAQSERSVRRPVRRPLAAEA